jgi:hypothetical protein
MRMSSNSSQFRYTAVGYHGTSVDNAQTILAEGFDVDRESEGTNPSWFGRGAYFWDNNEKQAWWWVRKSSTPAVIRASLDLTGTLDLTTDHGREKYETFIRKFLEVDGLRAQFEEYERDYPDHIDAFFLDTLHDWAIEDGKPGLGAIRGIVLRGDAGFAAKAGVIGVDR